jgi:hypothetical protein
MYKKRQRGGNFKGKRYQRSKPPSKQGGGSKWMDFARTMDNAGRMMKKASGDVRKKLYVQKGGSKWMDFTRMMGGAGRDLKKTRSRFVQKGGSMRPGPPRRVRNTIPNAGYVMYHR